MICSTNTSLFCYNMFMLVYPSLQPSSSSLAEDDNDVMEDYGISQLETTEEETEEELAKFCSIKYFCFLSFASRFHKEYLSVLMGIIYILVASCFIVVPMFFCLLLLTIIIQGGLWFGWICIHTEMIFRLWMYGQRNIIPCAIVDAYITNYNNNHDSEDSSCTIVTAPIIVDYKLQVTQNTCDNNDSTHSVFVQGQNVAPCFGCNWIAPLITTSGILYSNIGIRTTFVLAQNGKLTLTALEEFPGVVVPNNVDLLRSLAMYILLAFICMGLSLLLAEGCLMPFVVAQPKAGHQININIMGTTNYYGPVVTILFCLCWHILYFAKRKEFLDTLSTWNKKNVISPSS